MILKARFWRNFWKQEPCPTRQNERWFISEAGIRSEVAEVMWIRCNEKDEERLRQMSYDKGELVAVCAVESLEGGSQREPEKRVRQNPGEEHGVCL